MDNPNTNPRRAYAAEVALMVCYLFLLVGDLPPDVNEVHYLTKARYAWDPTFCPHDLFVTSPGAQPVFVTSLGWLTTVLGFSGAAWCGRLLAWLVFATGWHRVCSALRMGWGWGLFTLAFAAALNEDLHMAGEWYVGGLEAKSLSYGCVIWALASLLEGGIGRTVACLGLAMGFHPLVGGWAALAFAAAYLSSRRESGAMVGFKGLAVGLLIAIPCVLVSVVPLLRYDHGVDSSVVSKAHQIYVYTRLPHHLVPHLMRPLRIWRFAGLVVAWAFLAYASRGDVRCRLIHRITAFALGIALVGWAIDFGTLQVPAWGGHLLRYYWFRLGDVMVPWSMALVTGLALKHRMNRESVQGQALLAGCLVLVTWATLDSYSERIVDNRPPADRQGSQGLDLNRDESESCFRAWLQLCAWAKNNTPHEALFLTPVRSQTFRWYAERSEFANWKDMPQNAAGIVEWSERIQAVSNLGLYDAGSYITEEQVLEFARARAIDYVIVLRRSHPRPWNAHPVLRNSWFSLYPVAKTGGPRDDSMGWNKGL